MKRTNCLAIRGVKCCALTSKTCDKCRFYKTQEQFEKDGQAAHNRIKSLPEKIQCMIAVKYYGGITLK